VQQALRTRPRRERGADRTLTARLPQCALADDVTSRLFPGRQVRPYAEPVPENELVVGKTYFTVHYLGKGMQDPEMEALVYLGSNLFAEEPGFYFQDAASYRAGIRYETAEPDEYTLHCQLRGHVFAMEFERALDCLLYYSLIRSEGSADS